MNENNPSNRPVFNGQPYLPPAQNAPRQNMPQNGAPVVYPQSPCPPSTQRPISAPQVFSPVQETSYNPNAPIFNSQIYGQPPAQEKKGKWVTAKLILGIISIVISPIILIQSCAAGLISAISDSADGSGSAGFIVSLFLLVSGIIAVCARKAVSKAPWIIAAVLLWINYFLAKVLGGSFGDLIIWGFISFLIGVFYLIACVRTWKGYLIVGIISAVYLIIALL